jgi:hypothetical protein
MMEQARHLRCSGPDIRVKGSKRKDRFIKDDILGDIDAAGGDVKILQAFVHIAIA